MDSRKDVEQEILNTLREMHQLIYTTDTSKVINAVKDKDIVLFVGNTKCGKSTIVNYVIGNPLVANRVRGKTYNITKQDPSSPGPEIGVGSTSETTIPSAWPSTKISGVIVDAPGFNDNRGEAQDVANSFYIREIINNARSVKFGLISDIVYIINDNIGQFTNFIDKILTMLPHNGHLHKGMVMLLTKDRDGYTTQDIGEILKEKIMDQSAMKVNNRQLAEYLHRNSEQIVIIKMPENVGLVSGPEVFDTLIQTIESKAERIPKCEMATVIPGISAESRVFLLTAHRYFTELEEFDDVLKLALHEYSKTLAELGVEEISESTSETEGIKRKLAELENSLKSMCNISSPLFKKLGQLGALVPNVQQLQENSEMHLKLKFVSFIDEVLKIKESNIFNIKIHAVLSHMLDRTSQDRTLLQLKMMEISRDEAMKQMQEITENNKQVNEQMTKEINELKEKNTEIINKQIQDLGPLASIGHGVDKFGAAVIALPGQILSGVGSAAGTVVGSAAGAALATLPLLLNSLPLYNYLRIIPSLLPSSLFSLPPSTPRDDA